MNYSGKTYPENDPKQACLEIIYQDNASPKLKEKAKHQPELQTPNCPMKLHAFMVLASYEQIWDSEESFELKYQRGSN
ncbi:MAG: hypothetical protein HKN16_03115 [Saprospiraceae bacterium]|nr:hypothetical protein [Saprospiraceae bacterium]